MDYVIRYGHFLGFMVLFACLVASHLMTSKSLSGRQARTLARLDLIYGLSAVIVIITGVLMLSGYGFGKSAAFYMKNGLFHAKLTLFVIVVGLSLWPTMFLWRHRRASDGVTITVPKSVIMLQRFQLLALLILPLLGILIARGVGASG
jgi:putative membrane protein